MSSTRETVVAAEEQLLSNMIIRQCSRSGEHVLALFASALRSFHAPARSLCTCCEVRLWCCKAKTLTSHHATGRALLLRQSRPRQLQALSSSGSRACLRHGASKSRKAWATPAPTSRQHWVSNALYPTTCIQGSAACTAFLAALRYQ